MLPEISDMLRFLGGARFLADRLQVPHEEDRRDRELRPPHVQRQGGVLARARGVEQKRGLGEQRHEADVDGQVDLAERDLVHVGVVRAQRDLSWELRNIAKKARK